VSTETSTSEHVDEPRGSSVPESTHDEHTPSEPSDSSQSHFEPDVREAAESEHAEEDHDLRDRGEPDHDEEDLSAETDADGPSPSDEADQGEADEPEGRDEQAGEPASEQSPGEPRRYKKDRRRDRGLPPRMRIEIQPTAGPGSPGAAAGSQIMVVNDIPGEECRIAILEHGRLEALFSERASTATNVGNIYKGRVTNVEAAIQAAFVDFGEGQSGFLHISDLHPRYFPGPEKKERMGKKIPRRERPPIQEALRRGDEVLVQVLKQGIGTKGPTLTSYLSIPGRLLVMMPYMDKNGVSRKVEDEEQRRVMRKILDSLDLPDGFGFILRTAGFDRTKPELQRDAAYLDRLWSVMEDRIKHCGAPCELYTESDLLIRTIRDVVGPEIKAIVVDSRSAFERVSTFLRVVAPRSAPDVLYYDRTTPVFHAFDVERQIELIHARIVPLPSGGALVIEQTEALVAIDVNSGRSRAARDSETNAFQTNCEAVEEICRQIRLRDLGGLIINDLIDMRSAKHRRDIEERFVNTLKKDRARTTILPISEFGILEMTRQRMRPSIRKAHYMDCPHCAGHGEIKMPESVAADAIRHIGYLMQFDRIKRVEMVCSTRVASVLLGGKRRVLVAVEDQLQKRIDIRISEALAADRVDFYAYDERGADVDLTRLPPLGTPKLGDFESSPDFDRAEAAAPVGRERKRRRRNRRGPADATAIALEVGLGDWDDEEADEPIQAEPAAAPPQNGAPALSEKADASGRRRRRRGRRDRHGAEEALPAAPTAPIVVAEPPPPPAPVEPPKPRRVFELAKECEVTSKEVLARCKELELEVKNHMSVLPGEAAERVKATFMPEPPPPPTPTVELGEPDDSDGPDDEFPASAPGQESEGGRKRRRRRRRGRGGLGAPPHGGVQPERSELEGRMHSEGPAQPSQPHPPDQGGQAGGKRRKRRRRGRGANGGGAQVSSAGRQPGSRSEPSASPQPKSAPGSQASQPSIAPPPRRLFATRTRVSPAARAAAKKSE
jgi:ribonuclease E